MPFSIPPSQQASFFAGTSGPSTLGPTVPQTSTPSQGDYIIPNGSGPAGSPNNEASAIIQLLQQILETIAAALGGDSGTGGGGLGSGAGTGTGADSGFNPDEISLASTPQNNNGGEAPDDGDDGGESQGSYVGGQPAPSIATYSGGNDQSLVSTGGSISSGNGTFSGGGTLSGSTSSGGSVSDGSLFGSNGPTIGPGLNLPSPVPLNGGAQKGTPTTNEDNEQIINSIDPSVLTNPAEPGTGALKGIPYGRQFEVAGEATGVDPRLLWADAQVESGDNKYGKVEISNNVNPNQTAPGVWSTSSNSAVNVLMGARVMKSYINDEGGNLAEGLNAYNTGDLSPSDPGFADGFSSYAGGVASAYKNVLAAIADPSLIQPGQGGNVSLESQISVT